MTRLHTHVHVVHETRGRIRLKIPHHLRRTATTQDMRDWLHADLYDVVDSVTINPHTGSVVIHHNSHDSFAEELATAFLRFGLTVVLDDTIEIDGAPENKLVTFSLLGAAHGINYAIERAGWCTVQRVFFWARAWAHLQRIFAGGRLNTDAVGAALADVGIGYGLALLLA